MTAGPAGDQVSAIGLGRCGSPGSAASAGDAPDQRLPRGIKLSFAG